MYRARLGWRSALRPDRTLVPDGAVPNNLRLASRMAVTTSGATGLMVAEHTHANTRAS